MANNTNEKNDHEAWSRLEIDSDAPPPTPSLTTVEDTADSIMTLEEEDEHEELEQKQQQQLQKKKAGKPQVIVRIRPEAQNDEDDPDSDQCFQILPAFEVDPETKTIQIRVEQQQQQNSKNHQQFQNGLRLTTRCSTNKSSSSYIYFRADNILQETVTPDEVFQNVALEVIEKAMDGLSGMIVAVGPEESGKSFSLFGVDGEYGERGIVPRCLEKIFEVKATRSKEIDLRFGLGIVEVRREKIRDLLTLEPKEITEVGDRGPKGMYIEEVDCLENGLGLTLRALFGQKLIHEPHPHERFHTIVYLEILAFPPGDLRCVCPLWNSRVTLVELGSPTSKKAEPEQREQNMQLHPSLLTFKAPPPPCSGSCNSARKCVNPGYASGPLAETIAIRRDFFALEQIFLRANEMHQLRKHHQRLEELGLTMLASEKRKISSGHNFRRNKLAYCLKDIMNSSGTEIRILLHVRSERSNLKQSLEAMRFAERAKLVPLDGDLAGQGAGGKGKNLRKDDQLLQEVILDVAPELIQMQQMNMQQLSGERMRKIQEQAVQYFEQNIDAMNVCSKEKAKEMFERFRVFWNYLSELEMSINLKKAEEDLKQQYGIQGEPQNAVAPDGDKNVSKKKNENDVKEKAKKSIYGSAAGGQDQTGNELEEMESGSEMDVEMLDLEQVSSRHSATGEGDEEGEGQEGKSKDQAQTETPVNTNDGDKGGHRNQRVSKKRVERQSMKSKRGKKGQSQRQTNAGETLLQPSVASSGVVKIKSRRSEMSTMTENDEETGALKVEEEEEDQPHETEASLNNELPDLTSGFPSSTTQDQEDESQIQSRASKEQMTSSKISLTDKEKQKKSSKRAKGNNRTRGYFQSGLPILSDARDFKMFGFGGQSEEGDDEEGDSRTIPMSSEERSEQEQNITANFEEMKSEAKRQAYHLLRAGITKPKWMK